MAARPARHRVLHDPARAPRRAAAARRRLVRGRGRPASYYGAPLRLAADARRFDLSPAWLNWVGTAPALALIEEVGVETIHAHDLAWPTACATGSVSRPDSAIVSVDGLPGDAADRLEAAGVMAAGPRWRLRSPATSTRPSPTSTARSTSSGADGAQPAYRPRSSEHVRLQNAGTSLTRPRNRGAPRKEPSDRRRTFRSCRSASSSRRTRSASSPSRSVARPAGSCWASWSAPGSTRSPRTELASHYAKAVDDLDEHDLSMLAAWHASLEVGHADRQQGVPGQRVPELGDNRREALKIAAGFRGEEAFDAGVAEEQALETVLPYLSRERCHELVARVRRALLLGPARLRQLSRGRRVR